MTTHNHTLYTTNVNIRLKRSCELIMNSIWGKSQSSKWRKKNANSFLCCCFPLFVLIRKRRPTRTICDRWISYQVATIRISIRWIRLDLYLCCSCGLCPDRIHKHTVRQLLYGALRSDNSDCAHSIRSNLSNRYQAFKKS